MSTLRGSRKLQRGAAALEFALVVPILIMLVFGVVDFGLMISNQAVFANASRDAARTGSFFGTKSEIETVVTSETKFLPTVSNVDNIVVDGKTLTKKEFIDTYCAGQTGNTTCISVGNALSQEGTKSTTPP